MSGSGSRTLIRAGSKATTESRLQLDVRYLKKNNVLKPGTTGILSWMSNNRETASLGFKVQQDRLILNYRHRFQNNEWEDIQEVINFDRTPCNYGGKRVWLLCPQCRRRLVVLYLDGKYFLCRHCHRLTYAVQQISMETRLFRNARKLRKRLGGSSSLFDPIPQKPKGMHWKTYSRFYCEAEQAAMKCFVYMDHELEKTRGILLRAGDNLKRRLTR